MIGARQKVLMVMEMMSCLLVNVGGMRLRSRIKSHLSVTKRSIQLCPEAVWCEGPVSIILSDSSAMSSRTSRELEEYGSNMSAFQSPMILPCDCS